MKARIATIRRVICHGCSHPCQKYLDGKIDHTDPAAFCPEGVWHVYHGEGGIEPSAGPSPTVAEQMLAMGRKAWLWLHTEADKNALTTERLAGEFLPMIPAYGCGCRRDWGEILQKNPLPKTLQAEWAIAVHNIVNVKLGKPAWKPDTAS